MDKVLLLGMAGTTVVWLWAISGSLGVPVPAACFAPMTAVTLLVIHGVEVPLLVRRLKRDGQLPTHIVGILMFGLLYYYSQRLKAHGQPA